MISTDLISHIIKFKNYYLFISGIYGGKTLSITNRELEIVQEFKFEKIEMWGVEFHLDEENNSCLISVITSETYPIESRTYQGYSTHWYRLVLKYNQFEFELVDKWGKSDLRTIKSYLKNGIRHWIGLRQLNYIYQSGGVGDRTVICYENSKVSIKVPELKKAIFTSKSIDPSFDFISFDNEILITGICRGDRATILKLTDSGNTVQINELDVPLKKLHHYDGSKIIQRGQKVFAYFWTTSHEASKKYQFEMYRTFDLVENCLNKNLKKVVESDFVHSIGWCENDFVSYKKIWQESKKYIAQINDDGDFYNEKVLQGWLPIAFGYEGDLICIQIDGKELKILNKYYWQHAV